MRYDEIYKESVRSSISSAIDKLATLIVDSTDIPTIPSDFERAGDVKNVITGISNINLDNINCQIEDAIDRFEANNQTAGERFLDAINLGKKQEKNIEELNRKNATAQRVAAIQLKKEQDRINNETKEVQERTQASLKNGVVAFYIGSRKMGENIQDFMITRKAELQAEHIRQMYNASKQSKEMFGEEAEEEAIRIEKEAMVKTEKNKTQEYADKLYEENPELQKIDDRAYDLFKRTGTGYKIVEGTPVVASSAVIMAVAPEAAPVIIPVMVGVNSAGQATEEYLHDKKSNSKEGITQSYENGEISKEEYDNYEYIWNLTDEEVEKYAKNNNLTKEEVEAINKIRNMNEEWTTEENLTDANLYGNAVGIVDGLMSAGGMQLYRFNPFGNDLLNRGTRVLIDTASAAADVPIKATIRSVIDDDKDFKTAFEDMGGMQAVVTSAIIGFGGSLLGEIIDARKAKKAEVDSDGGASRTRAEIDNDSNVSRTRAEIDNDSNVSRTRTEIDDDSNVSRTRTQIDDDRYVLKTSAEIDSDSTVELFPDGAGTSKKINQDSKLTQFKDKIIEKINPDSKLTQFKNKMIETAINDAKMDYIDPAHDINEYRLLQKDLVSEFEKYSAEDILNSFPKESRGKIRKFCKTKDQIIGMKTMQVLQGILDERGSVETIAVRNGVEFKAYKDSVFAKQSLAINHIESILDSMPPALKNRVSEIVLSDMPCPSNAYFSANYAIKDFEASATGGTGTINIYPNRYGVNVGGVTITAQELYHEAAHNLDFWLKPKYQSGGSSWNKAMIADEKTTGFKAPTTYAFQAKQASGTNVEDFAESVSLYCINRNWFTTYFPNRAAYLDWLFKTIKS